MFCDYFFYVVILTTYIKKARNNAHVSTNVKAQYFAYISCWWLSYLDFFSFHKNFVLIYLATRDKAFRFKKLLIIKSTLKNLYCCLILWDLSTTNCQKISINILRFNTFQRCCQWFLSICLLSVYQSMLPCSYSIKYIHVSM